MLGFGPKRFGGFHDLALETLQFWRNLARDMGLFLIRGDLNPGTSTANPTRGFYAPGSIEHLVSDEKRIQVCDTLRRRRESSVRTCSPKWPDVCTWLPCPSADSV